MHCNKTRDKKEVFFATFSICLMQCEYVKGKSLSHRNFSFPKAPVFNHSTRFFTHLWMPRSFLCPVIGEKTADAAAMAAKERSAFYFSKTVFSPSVSKRRSPLRKRPGFNKPISFHFLRLGLEWEGLVYCGAFARTIKRILPPWGQLSLKGELSMFWKGILTGGEMKPLTSKIGVHGAKRAKK